MVSLVVKLTDSVKEHIERFQKIISAYDLRVVKQAEDAEMKTITLTVNAHTLAYVRSVNTAAYDCFGEDLQSFTSHQ